MRVGLWVCLQGIISIMFIEVGRTRHCGGISPEAEDPALKKMGKRE